MQVLQKRLRSLNDDLKRNVAAELDGLAAQVPPYTSTCSPEHLLTLQPDLHMMTDILSLKHAGYQIQREH